MHFRNIIITGLAACAVMFLQDQAFAAKNETNGSQHSVHAAVQADSSIERDFPVNRPVKEEKASSVERPPAKPKLEKQSKNMTQKANAHKNVTQKANAHKKVAEKLNHLPEQARGKVQSARKKVVPPPSSQKADTVKNNSKAADVQKKTRTADEQQPVVKKNPVTSIKKDFEVENKAPSAAKNAIPDKKHLHINKVAAAEPLVKKPLTEGKKPPVEQEKVPRVDQVLNPTQRTNGSGGTSSDRVSTGLGTISTVDKWFEWNQHYEIQLNQPYLSRLALLTNQWVNAPPSPPPQYAPIFKNVSHS